MQYDSCFFTVSLLSNFRQPNQAKFSADELRKEGEKIHERTETVDSTWNPISTNNTVYLSGNSRSRQLSMLFKGRVQGSKTSILVLFSNKNSEKLDES